MMSPSPSILEHPRLSLPLQVVEYIRRSQNCQRTYGSSSTRSSDPVSSICHHSLSSGHGKTTLLRALAGDLSADSLNQGRVLYNGEERANYELEVARLVGYVAQEDFHFPTMTVRETLEFAAACSTTVSSLNAPCW